MSNNQSALRNSLSVLGKLFLGTRKGTSGERARLLKNCQRTIGVRFTDLSLLEQALTHRSYSHVTSQTRNDSNERMEFLGDSVLGLSVSQFLYLRFPERSEGALSKMKSLLVSRKVLSSVARECGLGEYILLSGEESEMGGRDRASILADSFEGVIGAIYLDQGYRAANAFITRFLLASINDILDDEEHTNYKSLLQEYVQSKRLSHPVYRVRREEGPEHEKEFAIDVVVKGQVWGTGRGKSKKDAEQSAARSALEQRQGEAPRSRSRRDGGKNAPGEPTNGHRTESASREERGRRGDADAPRAGRSRGRGRPDDLPASTEARDRGGHGVAASRASLRRSREEAAQEPRAERKGRPRSRTERTPPAAPPSGDDVRSGAKERPARSRRRRGGRGARDVASGSPRAGNSPDVSTERAPAEPARTAEPPATVEAGPGPVDSGRPAERTSERAPGFESAPAPEYTPAPEPAPASESEETPGFVRRRRRSGRSRPAPDTVTGREAPRVESTSRDSQAGPEAPDRTPVDVVEARPRVEADPSPGKPVSNEASSSDSSSDTNGTSSFARRKKRSTRGLRRR